MGEAKRRNTTNPAGWTNTFRAGRYICEMSYSPGSGLAAKWSPAVPTRSTFSDTDMAQYRAGRTALLAEVSKAIGGAVLVLEA